MTIVSDINGDAVKRRCSQTASDPPEFKETGSKLPTVGINAFTFELFAAN